jgi:hypothetical protein
MQIKFSKAEKQLALVIVIGAIIVKLFNLLAFKH